MCTTCKHACTHVHVCIHVCPIPISILVTISAPILSILKSQNKIVYCVLQRTADS